MLSNADRSRLALASRAASRSLGSKHSLGAVLVSGGRVLAAAPNRVRNDAAVIDPENCSEHAEAAVLRLAGASAAGASVYVARINRAGEYRMARPCNRCAAAMFNAGVQQVIYTVDSGRAVRERLDTFSPERPVIRRERNP